MFQHRLWAHLMHYQSSAWLQCFSIFFVTLSSYFLHSFLNILLTIYKYTQSFLSRKLVHQQFLYLQTKCSALLIRWADLSCQIEEIDESIQGLTRLSSLSQPALHQQSTGTVHPSNISTTTQSFMTPSRPRWWHNIRSSSIRIPYPLPFTPLRAPEEERRHAPTKSQTTWTPKVKPKPRLLLYNEVPLHPHTINVKPKKDFFETLTATNCRYSSLSPSTCYVREGCLFPLQHNLHQRLLTFSIMLSLSRSLVQVCSSNITDLLMS